jgi:hypothetical protein
MEKLCRVRRDNAASSPPCSPNLVAPSARDNKPFEVFCQVKTCMFEYFSTSYVIISLDRKGIGRILVSDHLFTL